MNRFVKVFNRHRKFSIIGMIHLNALPGTPKYAGNWAVTMEKALHEADVYTKHNLDSILIENMHDVPYIQDGALGPETVACMTRIANEVRRLVPAAIPCGIQVLACGNRQAVAVAKACGLQFIRTEGFVFAHVADEGYTDACAGGLLRYRKQIDAEDILIFTDIKKKHSSHSITQDVNLYDTAKAAEFFLTDGVVITGNSTGQAASTEDLRSLSGKLKTPIIIGSGVTRANVEDYYALSDAAIIGSHFKLNGLWENDLSEDSISKFMLKIFELRSK